MNSLLQAKKPRPRNAGNLWTEDHEALMLLLVASGATLEEIGDALGRTQLSIAIRYTRQQSCQLLETISATTVLRDATRRHEMDPIKARPLYVSEDIKRESRETHAFQDMLATIAEPT